MVLIDATYWGRNFGVVIMKDSLSGDVPWFKFINRHERLEDYKQGISSLESLGYTIQGLVCDGFKGLRQANIDIYHNMYYLKFIFVYLPSNI